MNIETLRKQPHLSSSAISTYIDCSLMFKLARIDKYPVEHRSDAMEFGSAIHRAVADLNLERQVDYLMPLEALERTFMKYWAEAAEGAEDIKWSKGKNYQAYIDLGRVLLTEYHKKVETEKFKVLAVEEAFSFTIPGIDVPIVGIVDLIEEDEAGTVIISDLKTAGRAYSTDEIDQNDQLTLYNMAAKANGFSDREILLRFDVLLKTKEPRCEQYYTVRSEDDLMRMGKKVEAVWDGISKGVFIPNTGNWKCKGCSYKTYCEDWFRGEG